MKEVYFIEQYNDTYNQVHFTSCLLLEYLPKQLEITKNCITLFTVAIFKIKLK